MAASSRTSLRLQPRLPLVEFFPSPLCLGLSLAPPPRGAAALTSLSLLRLRRALGLPAAAAPGATTPREQGHPGGVWAPRAASPLAASQTLLLLRGSTFAETAAFRLEVSAQRCFHSARLLSLHPLRSDCTAFSRAPYYGYYLRPSIVVASSHRTRAATWLQAPASPAGSFRFVSSPAPGESSLRTQKQEQQRESLPPLTQKQQQQHRRAAKQRQIPRSSLTLEALASAAMDPLELLTSAALLAMSAAAAAAFAFVLFVAIGVLFQPRWIVRVVRKTLPHIVFEYVTKDKLVALTIDDGPNGEATNEILDILKEHECRATFFVIGSNMNKWPHLVERMHSEGHEIGNHTMDDVASWRLSLDCLEMSLKEVDNKIQGYFRRDENGTPLKWFRPGHGWTTKPMREMVESYGYRLALGSVFPVDPLFKKSGAPLASYCLWKIYPGAIIILHDRPQQATQTAEILRRMLPVLREQGYHVVTLSEMTQHADVQGKDPEAVSLL